MAQFKGFLGPAYESRAGLADLQRLVNLFLEKDESGNEEADWILYSTPGLSAFVTLPTSPIRGIWYGDYRLFVVAGGSFYEVFSNGSYSYRGTIATDAHPAYIFPNGNQVMIISANQVYIDTGTGIVQPYYTSAAGSVSVTSGTDVQLTYGDTFDATMVGNKILIDGTAYTVATLVDANHLTLDAPGLGVGVSISNVPYSIPNAGVVNVRGIEVQRLSGDAFVPALVGHAITINGSDYTVATWINGDYLYLSSGGGYQVGVPYTASIPVTASCGAVLDGFFIVATPSTKQVNISQQWNGLRWDPADYQIKEGYPDNILQMFADHEELWLWGAQSTEVWRNTGSTDFPFQRDPGAFIHKGMGAPYAFNRLQSGTVWLSSNEKGGPVAYLTAGFQPQRISTHALEYRWGNYAQWTDAESYSYVEEGHEFWVISFPTPGETWVFDANNGTWHQRAYGPSLTRHRARNHAFAFNQHIVGDYTTGQMYTMSAEYFTDAGTAIKRIRRAPHIRNQMVRTSHAALKLIMTHDASQTVTFAWSNDYGEHWTAPRNPDSKLIGDGIQSHVLGYRWNRLGSFYDRVYELVIVNSTSKVAITELDVEGA